jgi:hypothetical protein
MHKQKGSVTGERRRQVRYEHHSEASCRLIGTEGGAAWPVVFQDVSCGGATLLMKREVHAGAVLEVTIPGHGGRFSGPLLMRVRNVRPGLGAAWKAGCSFVRPLTPHDVEVLLLEIRAGKEG